MTEHAVNTVPTGWCPESDETLCAGYDSARRSYGDSYADYLIAHDVELWAKGISPTPWPASLAGNDGI